MRIKTKFHLSELLILFLGISPLVCLLLINGTVLESGATLPTESLPSISGTVDKILPSVVYLSVETNDRLTDRLVTSSGSGVIFREDGFILTNKHVVRDAQSTRVMLQSGQVFEATDIWLDDLLDLAVIKIEADNLPPVRLSNPDSIKRGDWVIALGYPLGLSPQDGGASVTVGIISNLERSFAIDGVPHHNIIQTDAAINPGNSGGPLVNMAGEVIGINSAKTTSIIVEGMGYAISINQAMPFIEQLAATGDTTRPWLGVLLYSVDQAAIERYGLAVTNGALVLQVVAGSPADKTGVKPGDVITSFAGQEITSGEELLALISLAPLNKATEITFWRGESAYDALVILTEKP